MIQPTDVRPGMRLWHNGPARWIVVRSCARCGGNPQHLRDYVLDHPDEFSVRPPEQHLASHR
ncbi:hypothetical protein KEH56_36530 [Burkholderia cenocepacia]|uniref:hypothetical protein n=1 Tax=Burkholderia cenocepacia TaxID=95486 RepID=UPI001BAB4F47|nr:hypothetical protein [Burkholderia cenocepacia]QUN44679.1 hypothetical protein KEH56_36530 [Burkholderia cenocepacia]